MKPIKIQFVKDINSNASWNDDNCILVHFAQQIPYIENVLIPNKGKFTDSDFAQITRYTNYVVISQVKTKDDFGSYSVHIYASDEKGNKLKPQTTLNYGADCKPLLNQDFEEPQNRVKVLKRFMELMSQKESINYELYV
jgi:hypothetical protein